MSEKDSKLWIVFHKRGSCSQNVAINWEARKQNTVALSSTAAKYMELPEASEEAIHLRQLIEETTDGKGRETSNKSNLSCENKAYRHSPSFY
ncbi:hypothetical protein T12_4276 [Trichinella patagoniensis]|uniref:Uncharacterized protein n=1 Tax=Trichinella patagoniensis TaxID=990121 RepID=A0A0V1A5P7_9BILA|nr:hypothetical protein T12_4276 [Trichinella patagoniensis]